MVHDKYTVAAGAEDTDKFWTVVESACGAVVNDQIPLPVDTVAVTPDESE
jgi:hypothetical protein